MVVYLFLLVIFIIVFVLLFWIIKNDKIIVSKEDLRNKGKYGIIKGIIWFWIAVLLFAFEYKIEVFQGLPDLFYTVVCIDVDSIIGPLPAMFAFPFLLAYIVAILGMIFCVIMSIKSFLDYFKN